jgi:hypothetical protein
MSPYNGHLICWKCMHEAGEPHQMTAVISADLLWEQFTTAPKNENWR